MSSIGRNVSCNVIKYFVLLCSASSALVGLLDGLLQSGTSAAQRKKIEVGEQKKKRMKSDTDTTRFSSASMRSQLDQATNLKGEQVSTSAEFGNIS
jgi:hypothetical protein